MYASEIAYFLFCEINRLVGSWLQTVNSTEEAYFLLVKNFWSSLKIRRNSRWQLVDLFEVGYF